MGSTMTDKQPPSPKTTILCGLLAIGLGLFMVLIGVGVVKPDPRSVHGPLWVATCAGLVFMLAGLSVAVGALNGVSQTGELPRGTGWWLRLLYYALGLAACAGLAVIGSWVAFGPGTRSFGGSGMMPVPRDFGELFGRVMFGLGAVVTWLCVIALAVSGGRKLFRREQA
jgi:dipeptide/tripeptide permease